MKVAGRKNDGAWYRANVVIKALSPGEKVALASVFAGLASINDYLTAIQEFYLASVGTSDPNYPADVGTLAGNYTTFGIPRQTWMGVLSYDTYTRAGSTGDYTYSANHQAIAFTFGKEIRKAMKDFTFARRQARDLSNNAPRTSGNPGGIADATPGN